MGTSNNSRRIATATLSETSQIQINDVVIDFTSIFDQTWNDQGSGAHEDGSAWRPRAENDFYPLGDMMIPGYNDPNGNKVAMIAKDMGSSANPALMPPTGFSYIWSGQVFMMNAPDGYVALGGIATNGDLPDVNLYRCVRKDLVVQALVGGQIYNDQGSGRRDDLGAWAIAPGTAPAGSADLAPSTFIPVGTYDTPPPIGFWAFEFAVPEQPPATPPPLPILTSKNPPPNAGPSVQYIVHLPWFAVNDPGLSGPDQVVKSPVYSMIRTDQYTLAQFKNNNTNIEQNQSYTWSAGISSEQVTSFSHTVGIELGMEWTIAKDVFSVSAKLSYSFTYTTSSSQGMESSTQMTDTLTVPAGTAAAAYYISSSYDIYRQDGTRIQSVTPGFDVPSSTYTTQYPPAGPARKARVG